MMASPPPPRRRWLLEGAGAAFQHVLTASRSRGMTKLSTISHAYEPGLIARLLGVVLEAAHAHGGKATAQMNVCVPLPRINSLRLSYCKA